MQQNIEFERCIDFLVRMIDKYGDEVLRELEEEKQNKEEKKRQFSEIQNVNRTVAFLHSKSNKFQKLIQSVWLVILGSGNTSIKWFEMILCIKIQKKFIIFAFKKFHNTAYGIFETGYGFQRKSQ